MHQTTRFLKGLAIAGTLALAPQAAADITTPYTLSHTFTLPGNTYDLMPDGRLLAVAGDGTVSVQNAINSSTYTPVGSVGQINTGGFDPAFVSLSPDGSTLAIGNNEFGPQNAVLFFNSADALTGNATPTATITTPNFLAGWADSDTLYVSGADSATFDTVVNRIDLGAGPATTVITPAGAFSGGVAIAGTTLYAGAGDTGDVYAFDESALASATAPVSLTDGVFIASNASAGSIDFDNLGNIIIAGGVFDFGTGGFAGSAAVIDPMTGDRQTLTPAGTETFYGSYFNPSTNEIVVTADGTAYVYVVPSPSTAAPMALLLFAGKRRRRTCPARGEGRAERSGREWFACV